MGVYAEGVFLWSAPVVIELHIEERESNKLINLL